MRLLAYCLMPNHFHLLLWSARDRHLSRYMQWVTLTHMRRWHAHRRTSGTEPAHEGRSNRAGAASAAVGLLQPMPLKFAKSAVLSTCWPLSRAQDSVTRGAPILTAQPHHNLTRALFVQTTLATLPPAKHRRT